MTDQYDDKARKIAETLQWWAEGQDYHPSHVEARLQLQDMIAAALREASKRDALQLPARKVEHEHSVEILWIKHFVIWIKDAAIFKDESIYELMKQAYGEGYAQALDDTAELNDRGDG